MINKKEFLAKYNISAATFTAAGLTWEELSAIHVDYELRRSDLEPIASLFVNLLRRVPQVHSLKARTKDPEHLIEKIIRKRAANKKRKITLKNYLTEINDLIGVRALHLFKGDWLPIHESIISSFKLLENPTANIREGDANDIITFFKKNKWPIRQHEFGYRSVHYLVTSQPGIDEYVIEIQVRTIFEEGWSEIDHQTRYPYDLNNELLTNYLALFNRLAGSADEMGTFVKMLKDQITAMQTSNAEALAKKDRLISELKEQIEQSKIQPAVKRTLVDGLTFLSGADLISADPPPKIFFNTSSILTSIKESAGLAPVILPISAGLTAQAVGALHLTPITNIGAKVTPDTGILGYNPVVLSPSKAEKKDQSKKS
jgi:ppGpp synthetase/RelA/SpoT-type nucleotidyltranferase